MYFFLDAIEFWHNACLEYDVYLNTRQEIDNEYQTKSN